MGFQVVRQGRRLIHQQTAQQALTAGREQLRESWREGREHWRQDVAHQ